MKRQPGFLYRGKRKAPLIAALVMHYHNFLSGIPFDTGELDFVCPSAGRVAHHVRGDYRVGADKPSPILCVPQRSFDSRRGDFQHVSLPSKILRIKPRLNHARCRRAIVNRHSFSILTLNANVENGTTLAAPDLELEKL